MINNPDVLFIVNSPFQCLCMFEAINHYSFSNYDVVFRPDSIKLNNEMVKRVLNEKGIVFSINRMHPVYDIFPLIFKKKKKYDVLFNGDYYSGGVYAYYFSILSSKRHGSLIYFDDGVETLRAYSKPPQKRTLNMKYFGLHLFCKTVEWLKGIGKPRFFTIFDVESERFITEHNDLTILRNKVAESNQRGVFIIGTNFDGIDVDKEEYFCLLTKLILYFQKKYPKEIIWYCPHRRNKDNEELMKLLKDNNVSVFNTQITVEYDFVQKQIYPVHIAGFGSTALYTLKNIFPESVIDNVAMQLRNQTVVISAFDRLYEEQCKAKGIGLIEFNNEK